MRGIHCLRRTPATPPRCQFRGVVSPHFSSLLSPQPCLCLTHPAVRLVRNGLLAALGMGEVDFGRGRYAGRAIAQETAEVHCQSLVCFLRERREPDSNYRTVMNASAAKSSAMVKHLVIVAAGNTLSVFTRRIPTKRASASKSRDTVDRPMHILTMGTETSSDSSIT